MFPYILGSVYVFFHIHVCFFVRMLDYIKIMLYICWLKKDLSIILTLIVIF